MIPLHPPEIQKPEASRIECPPVNAKHRGRCMPPGCNAGIRVDELIQRVDGKWMHEECVPHDGIEVWERREVA